MNDHLTHALRTLGNAGSLSTQDAEAAFGAILDGHASETSIAALLTGLRVKGETSAELAGAVRAVRQRVAAEGLHVPASGLIDTCGTGGDGANTVNVSTAAAIVVAACGVRVAKHGNRSASGNSGSSEVLAELGVEADAEPSVLSRCLNELGITFLFAPRFHPGLRAVGPIRRQLPFRTIFNLVGPLANPANPDFQLVGVAGESLAELVAEALAALGIRRAAVVTGSDGLDEVSLSGPTQIRVVENGSVERTRWTPEMFGLSRVTLADLRVSGPADSAARIAHMLAGEPGPIRDMILANAAAALWVVKPAPLDQLVAHAAQAVDSGAAAQLLHNWRAMSRGK